MISYRGVRSEDGCDVVRIIDGEPPHSLRKRLDLRNHSPSGFEWGYGGSGPAQLALAILADFFFLTAHPDIPRHETDHLALAYYQKFKFQCVGGLPHDGWTLTLDDIRAVLDGIHGGAESEPTDARSPA